MKHILRSRMLAAVMVITSSTLAFAHAQLKSADPAVGSSIATSPTEIRLTFSEAIEAKLSRIDLMDATDMIDDIASIAVDPNNKSVLVAKLKHPLAVGTYMVMWQAVSIDTHKTQGDYTFVIKP